MATRKIILSDRHDLVALVSEEDYQFLVQWRWTFKRSTGKYDRHVYACRNTWRRREGIRGQVKIMMHHAVLERMLGPRPPDHIGHHKDTNTLNNARENLEWITSGKNNSEGWKTRKKNGSPAARHGNDRTDREPNDQDSPTAPPY